MNNFSPENFMEVFGFLCFVVFLFFFFFLSKTQKILMQKTICCENLVSLVNIFFH